MELLYPWALTTLLVPVALYWVFRRRRPPSVVVSTVRPFRAAEGNFRRRLSVFEWCVLLALAVLALALARPRRPVGDHVVRAKGLDIVLALDMSGSMRAYDRPRGVTEGGFAESIGNGEAANRLEVAKAEIRRFVEARPNDRIGLIGFADLAYSFVPPTLDHGLLLARLAALEPGEIGDATGIASPIGSAVTRLKNSNAPRRVMVLFTDGTNTAENRLTPEQAAKLAREFSVIIHTVGIGSDNAYAVVDSPLGRRLAPVRDNFDVALLKDLAKITGGTYFHAADAAGLRRAMTEINRLEKTSVEQPKPIDFQEYSPKLALLALAVLLLGCVAENTWQFRLP